MTALPLPKPSSEVPAAVEAPGSLDATPVFALKELVARLNREQYKIQDLLSSLGFALRSFKNLNQFLELIPLIASRVTDADGGVLVLFKSNGQARLEQLHCQAASQTHCDDRAVRAALEKAIRQTNEHLATADPAEASTARNRAIEILNEAIVAALGDTFKVYGASVVIKNIRRGRLYAFSRETGYTWTQKRQKLIRLVADQTAVAIENDELTVELRQKERLDRELEIGAEIQLRLLPRQYPKIAGLELAAQCQTASRVGGDYYDFIVTNRNALQSDAHSLRRSGEPEGLVPWSIAIGDVMGKGVPAGLIMTMTRGMLRAEVLNGHSPARILQHLNQVMHADLENSHRFVTLFYSEYDPKTQILSYSNAAHNPPLLWQRSTDRITRLDTLGMLIGLDLSSTYDDAQIQLHPGDTLLYYTDGFTDAADPNGDRFDEDRLVKAFHWASRHCRSAQDILNYLFERVQTFIGEDRQNTDDMTGVILRVRDRS